jgi:hypothetical protein
VVDDDVSRGEHLAASYVQHYYAGRRPGRGGAIVGSADHVTRALEEYIQAGVTYPIIGSPSANVRYLDAFLEKVASRLES